MENRNIDPLEQKKRQDAVDFGRASVALSGLTMSPEAIALQHRFVRGEITLEECIAAVKALYPTP